MKTAFLLLSLAGMLGWTSSARSDENSPPANAIKVPLVFQGGHDTDAPDHGRPVVLIATALGVPPAVFRAAFSHVHPAPAGEQPDPDQVRRNKEALLSHLARYGVTNERLDEVSNYYRYRRESGELWRHMDAAGYALVKYGKLMNITITQPGAGYTTPPVVSIPGVGLTDYPLATLSFGGDLTTNGSVAAVVLSPLGDHEKGWTAPQSVIIRTDETVTPLPSPSPPSPPSPPSH
jgi:hypothetical protein